MVIRLADFQRIIGKLGCRLVSVSLRKKKRRKENCKHINFTPPWAQRRCCPTRWKINLSFYVAVIHHNFWTDLPALDHTRVFMSRQWIIEPVSLNECTQVWGLGGVSSTPLASRPRDQPFLILLLIITRRVRIKNVWTAAMKISPESTL